MENLVENFVNYPRVSVVSYRITSIGFTASDLAHPLGASSWHRELSNQIAHFECAKNIISDVRYDLIRITIGTFIHVFEKMVIGG